MTAAALVLGGVAALLWPPVLRVPVALRSLLDATSGPRRVRPVRTSSPRAVRVVLALTLTASVVLASRTVTGAAAGVALGAVAYRLMSAAESKAGRADSALRRAQLPSAIDVLVLMLRTGSAPTTALAHAATVVTGALAEDLRRLAALQLMGTPPHEVWAEVAADPALGPLAVAANRSVDSGAALADSWAKVAADLRAERGVRNEVLARRAGVAVLAPLGLCFLPAFICLGVVPIVIGLAADVFG